jgi:hypothetical protein
VTQLLKDQAYLEVRDRLRGLCLCEGVGRMVIVEGQDYQELDSPSRIDLHQPFGSNAVTLDIQTDSCFPSDTKAHDLCVQIDTTVLCLR